MDALFHDLLGWVGRNPGWAYVVVFLVGMSESLAVVGVVVPGVIILIGAGALVAAGAIDFWPTFLAAVAGAIAGDGLSYSLGRHFDQRIRDTWPFSRYPEQLAQGEAFFHRYGGWSVALGRFFGPIRAIVPVVAGMMRLPAPRFYFANVTSAFAQIFSYLLPGMLFGASVKLAAEAAVRLAVLGVGLLLGLWLAGWLIHRLYLLLAPQAGRMVAGLLHWADLHPRMGRVAQALANPDHPDARALAGLALLLILGVFLAGSLTGAAIMGPSELALNQSALDLGRSLHTPLADQLMSLIARFGEPLVLLPMAAAVFLYLLWAGRPRPARYWLVAGGFAVVAVPALGALLGVPRPQPGLNLALPWSFPSAPVLLATCLYGFLAVMISRCLPLRLRWMPYAVAAMLVLVIAWSRLYFGAEWLTDLLASIGLGLAWIAALGLAFRRHSRGPSSAGPILIVSVVALASAYLVYGVLQPGADPARYRPAPSLTTLSAADWLDSGWRELPARRGDLRHTSRHRLDFQFAGNPEALSKILADQGWTPAETLRPGNALHLLSPSLPLAELPVIPQVHEGHHETLAMTRSATPNQREVLRLWPTSHRLDDGRPLWVGNLTTQRKSIAVGLLAVPLTEPEPPADKREILETLRDRLPVGQHLLLTVTSAPNEIQ